MVACSIAIVYTCAYDGWAAYDPIAKPTRTGIAQRPAAENTPANKTTAIHYAIFRALIDQFPAVKKMFEDRMTALGLDPTNGSVVVSTPIGVGNKSAELVLTFRHGDGSNQDNGYADTSGYVSVNPPLNPFFPTSSDNIPFPDR